METVNTPTIVSEGTLKTSDLIEAFAGFIENHRFDHADWFDLHSALADYFEGHLNDEQQDYLLEDLRTVMEDIAGPNVYFGTAEGDGACFGFWPLPEEEKE